MQKYLWFIILLVLSVHGSLIGQMIVDGDTLYGNEWINYDQTYYKIKVAEDGIYRISGATLAGQGFPVGDVEASELQLFWMGKEQPIFTSTKGKLGAEDFLEFYGRKNRSELDRFLFKDPDREMLNPEYSLYTDTSVYFLTWSAGTHVRYEDVEMGDPQDTLSSYSHRQIIHFSQRSIKKRNGTDLFVSSFEEGEGFGSAFAKNRTINIPYKYKLDTSPIEVSWNIVSDIQQHDLEVTLNNQIVFDSSFWGFHHLQNKITFYDKSNSQNLSISILGKNAAVTDRYSIGRVKIKYNRFFNFGNIHFQKIRLQSTPEIILPLANFSNNSSDCYFLDPINNLRIQSRFFEDQLYFALPTRTMDSDILLYNSELGVRQIHKIEQKSFKRLPNDKEFIIITNSLLANLYEGKNWIEEYKNYRLSENGGGFKTEAFFH